MAEKSLSSLSNQEILALKRQNSIRQIATQFGVSYDVAAGKVRRAGEALNRTSGVTRQIRSAHKPISAFHVLTDVELVGLTDKGQSYRQIAESFGISLDQVRNRMYRARRRLGLVVEHIPRTEIERTRSPVTDEDDRRWLALIRAKEERERKLLRSGRAVTYMPSASSSAFCLG